MEARGKSESTLDSVCKALARYEAYTGGKDFKTFRREQAAGFKTRLAEADGVRTGETLSASTQAATLAAIKEFFTWLAWRPGFKSAIHREDIEYLNPSIKDAARARAAKMRDFPSLEQIRAAIAIMPAETAIDRRDRALVAFTILTGIRDRAMVSLSLAHIDTAREPPVVRQDPNSVETKFAKAIVTYFFPVGDDFAAIVQDWIGELRRVHLFGPLILCSREPAWDWTPRAPSPRRASSGNTGATLPPCGRFSAKRSRAPACLTSRLIPSVTPSAI